MNNALEIKNANGTEYRFTVENYKIYVDAKAKNGKWFLFKVTGKTVVDGKLSTTEVELPIHQDGEKINDFIKNANTRELKEFNTHEEMMEAVRNEEKDAGSCFETKEGKHCFYTYKNRKAV